MFVKPFGALAITLGLLVSCNLSQPGSGEKEIPYQDYPSQMIKKDIHALFSDWMVDGTMVFTETNSDYNLLSIIRPSQPDKKIALRIAGTKDKYPIAKIVQVAKDAYLAIYDPARGDLIDISRTPIALKPLEFKYNSDVLSGGNVGIKSIKDLGDRIAINNNYNLSIYGKVDLLSGNTVPVWSRDFDGILDETKNNKSSLWSLTNDAESKKIYVAHNSKEYHTSTLTAMDYEGNILWENNIAKDTLFETKQGMIVKAYDGGVIVNITGDRMYSYDKDGNLLWKSTKNAGSCEKPEGGDGISLAPGLDFYFENNNLIFLPGTGTCFSVFDLRSGKIKWSQDLEKLVSPATTLLGNILIKGGKIYVANRRMFVFEVETGKIIRVSHKELPIEGGGIIRQPLYDSVLNKIIFAGKDLIAFDP